MSENEADGTLVGEGEHPLAIHHLFLALCTSHRETMTSVHAPCYDECINIARTPLDQTVRSLKVVFDLALGLPVRPIDSLQSSFPSKDVLKPRARLFLPFLAQ